jgi:hypothetical protein
VKKRIGSYPHVRVEGGGRGAVTQAGSVLLVETIRKTGLDQAISAALARHRPFTDVITEALDRLHALPNPG